MVCAAPQLLYYEVYGRGEPLLLVHGNGGSIADLSAQIAHFRKRYKVIAMDSRDQGRSGDTPDKLTYEKMTDDLAALLDHLKTVPVNVLGWSDGAIQALLLAIRHPAKVKKIAAMAANLNPSEDALHPEVIAVIKSMIAAIPAAERDTPQGRRQTKVTQLLLDEPHIELKALEAITAPTLVLAGDHDIIRDEHTVDIYHHIPNSQLAIFPNATHMVPFDDPALFNAIVERFLPHPVCEEGPDQRHPQVLGENARLLGGTRAVNRQPGTRPNGMHPTANQRPFYRELGWFRRCVRGG